MENRQISLCDHLQKLFSFNPIYIESILHELNLKRNCFKNDNLQSHRINHKPRGPNMNPSFPKRKHKERDEKRKILKSPSKLSSPKRKCEFSEETNKKLKITVFSLDKAKYTDIMREFDL